MALEVATFLADLVDTNPPGTDPKSQGDDHIRLLKSTLQATLKNVGGERVLPTTPALASIKSSTGGHDIMAADISLVFGADTASQARTDATAKLGHVGGAHYTNAEEPVALVGYQSNNGESRLILGGGHASLNAVETIRFFTAADDITVTGTEWMRLNSDGSLGMLEALTPAFTSITKGIEIQLVSANPGIRLERTTTNASIAELYAGSSTVVLKSVGTEPIVLSINGNNTFTVQDAQTAALLQWSDAGASQGPNLVLDRNSASPLAADNLAAVQWRGRNSGAANYTYGDMYMILDDPTALSEDGHFLWRTSQAGAVAIRMLLASGLWMTGATGADQGAGTINATAVYDDGVLLTCYPLEFWLDGTINQSKWDATVNDRPLFDAEARPTGTEPRAHTRAASFAAVATQRLDPKQFSSFIKTNRHLPAMPSPAEWAASQGKMGMGDLLQRLWETVEVQSIHISQLVDRIEVLEAA